MSTWNLEQAYDAYPRIEEEFQEALDVSLQPRGPDMLYGLVEAFELPHGATAVDVGCGEGKHVVGLTERFGFAVTGVDPLQRHIDIASEFTGATYAVGTAESIPLDAASVELVWCRDVLCHVADLTTAYAEFQRVLKPGGRALIYQMYGTDLLETREAEFLWSTMGVVPSSAVPANTEAAIAAAGLTLDERFVIGTEWGEFTEERTGKAGQQLLRASRLLRSPEVYLERYGRDAYDMMLGDCLWGIYAMIGKLSRRVYILSR